jgi:hypothetical protein
LLSYVPAKFAKPYITSELLPMEIERERPDIIIANLPLTGRRIWKERGTVFADGDLVKDATYGKRLKTEARYLAS